MLKIISTFIITTFLLLSSLSRANILISPTRIVINDNQRTAEVFLFNSSNETRNYRIDWKTLISKPNGGYREPTQIEIKHYSGLERVTRISPKQVTLPPGNRQTIKLFLRDLSKLKKGEYRSHLSFTALPSEKKEANKGGIKLNVLLGYTIPVIYRAGNVIVNPTITDISLVHIKDTNTTNIKLDLFHDDLFSSHGRFVANWTPLNGKTREVALVNGYNFYPEIKNATTQFPWKDFKLEPGTLEVRYEGQAEFSGLLLAQKTLTITQQMVDSVR